jgi:predicted membrane-bound dolichyl-phosphate-mannose-protein mannosyltransferase
MRTSGNIAIVGRHTDKKARSKLADCGNTVMLIGYSYNHEKDVYKFLNIQTIHPIISTDAILVNKTN